MFLNALYSPLKHLWYPSRRTCVTLCELVCSQMAVLGTVTCVFFAILSLENVTRWTVSRAAAFLSSEYSRKHLLRAEPGSFLAVVVHCQCMLVIFNSFQSCLVTQCVNMNSAYGASWLVLGIRSPFRPWSDSYVMPAYCGKTECYLFIYWRVLRYFIKFHEKQIDVFVVAEGLQRLVLLLTLGVGVACLNMLTFMWDKWVC